MSGKTIPEHDWRGLGAIWVPNRLEPEKLHFLGGKASDQKNYKNSWLAETEGFEPSIGLETL
jgi:hypothetical protein